MLYFDCGRRQQERCYHKDLPIPALRASEKNAIGTPMLTFASGFEKNFLQSK
jgi:hypothetical protein